MPCSFSSWDRRGRFMRRISAARVMLPPASATVTAAGAVELAQLEPRDFYDIVSAYPVIWDELRREASRRELLNQNILAGDTRLV